jgi:hypothetical protein
MNLPNINYMIGNVNMGWFFEGQLDGFYRFVAVESFKLFTVEMKWTRDPS